MKKNLFRRLSMFACAAMAAALGASGALLGSCGPFTDFTDAVFCPFVLEIFYLGITTGTTATTYDPANPVSRLQMAAFLSRTVDAALKRASRRAALDQFWTSQNATVLGFTTVGGSPQYPASDGTDIWVPTLVPFNVARVRASDGKLLETWTAQDAEAVLVAMGRVLVTGQSIPGVLSSIDPSQPAGVATLVASNLPGSLFGIAFDGSRVWVAGQSGALGIVTPGPTIPWTVTTVTAGFSALYGAIYDGANVWVTDQTLGRLQKLDASGTILQTVTVGGRPSFPVLDGGSLWVPNNFANTVSVVRTSTGVLLQTLTGNGLAGPTQAVFDGQRILVTNQASTTVSLWKAADLSPLGSFDLGSQPLGACSNGINFWIAMNDTGQVARF